MPVLLASWLVASALMAAPGSDAPHVQASEQMPSALDEGVRLLEAMDVAAARGALERALGLGPYSYEEVVRLYANLGVARAYADDQAGAADAFRALLSIDPRHALPYTISPKAAFLFERLRQEASTLPHPELRVIAPSVIEDESPLSIEIVLPADSAPVARVELLWRTEVNAPYVVVRLGSLPLETPRVVSLDWRGTSPKAPERLELSLRAFDDKGWEIFRNPSPAAPLRVPVRIAAEAPLWSQPALWLGIAGGLVGAAAATIVVVALSTPAPSVIETTWSFE